MIFNKHITLVNNVYYIISANTAYSKAGCQSDCHQTNRKGTFTHLLLQSTDLDQR